MDIAKTNNIADPHKIYTGQVLEIPGAASTSVPSSAGSTSLKGNSGSGVQMKSPYLGVSDQAYTDYMNSAYTRSDDLQSIYNQADAMLEQYKNTTNGERQQKINSIVEEYENMDPFSYDFATDPMFQNMLASYQQMGQSAMKDSIAQSSALTGGYANSWAQTAGQQSYNRHIQDAFNNLPSYYQMALETYRQEGQKLLDMYGLLDSEQQKELDQILNQHGIIYGKARDFESDERSDYSTNLTKQWNDITLSNSEAWKSKEYNATQADRATKLAMEEAEMQANGYVKKANGSWEYVGGEDPYKKLDDYLEAFRYAQENGATDAELAQLLEDFGIKNTEEENYLDYFKNSVGLGSSWQPETLKSVNKQVALAGLAANLLGTSSDFDNQYNGYDLTGLGDFYNMANLKKAGLRGYWKISDSHWYDGGDIKQSASINTPYGEITMGELYDSLAYAGVDEGIAKQYVMDVQNKYKLN